MGRESKTRDMTPSSWEKRYQRIGISMKSLSWMAIITYIIFMVTTKNADFAIPGALTVAVVMSIPLAMSLAYVYRTADILDVDNDPERFAEVIKTVKNNIHWFQRGWVNTEYARSLIATGKFDEAKAFLYSEEMDQGMSRFYKARKIELLGICAIINNNEADVRKYKAMLDDLEKGKSICCDNSKEIVRRIRANWDYLEGATS